MRPRQRAAVNVRAIAQGASERNISVVVDAASKATTRALRATHASFYLSPQHAISIGVIGPGTVGRVLLDQLASQSEARLSARVQAGSARARHHVFEEACMLSDRRCAELAQLEGRSSPPRHGAGRSSRSFVEHVQR